MIVHAPSLEVIAGEIKRIALQKNRGGSRDWEKAEGLYVPGSDFIDEEGRIKDYLEKGSKAATIISQARRAELPVERIYYHLDPLAVTVHARNWGFLGGITSWFKTRIVDLGSIKNILYPEGRMRSSREFELWFYSDDKKRKERTLERINQGLRSHQTPSPFSD